MIISDFIIQKLESFLDKFKNMKVKYGVDRLANVHTVEVYPASMSEREDVFEVIDSIVTDTIKHYPSDLFCMGAPDAILGVGELIYEKAGVEYNPISSSNIIFIPRTNDVECRLERFTSFSFGIGSQETKSTNKDDIIEITNIDEYPLAA